MLYYAAGCRPEGFHEPYLVTMLLLFIIFFWFLPFLFLVCAAVATNKPTHIRQEGTWHTVVNKCTQFRCNPQSAEANALLSTIRQHYRVGVGRRLSESDGLLRRHRYRAISPPLHRRIGRRRRRRRSIIGPPNQRAQFQHCRQRSRRRNIAQPHKMEV